MRALISRSPRKGAYGTSSFCGRIGGRRDSTVRRVASLGLLVTLVYAGYPAGIEQGGKPAELPPVLTAKNVQANRSLPQFVPASEKPLIPDNPSDDEIGKVRLFPQRIVPVEKSSSRSLLGRLFSGNKSVAAKESNIDVARTLKTLQNSAAPLDITQLESFVKAHPQSRWAPSLRHELARRQFKRGFFAQAVAGWDALWDELKDGRELGAVEVANEVMSQLLDTYIGLGNADRLAALIGEQESRPGNPVIQAKTLRAKQAIWLLKHKGAQNVMCGPVARCGWLFIYYVQCGQCCVL